MNCVINDVLVSLLLTLDIFHISLVFLLLTLNWWVFAVQLLALKYKRIRPFTEDFQLIRVIA